mmetsp:Transcript_17631/g.55824  ORF Transcript_17631/g.55824 Transcript_17631/m.55824 type:complete len:236 (-) Transcript_17631:50-757(-)
MIPWDSSTKTRRSGSKGNGSTLPRWNWRGNTVTIATTAAMARPGGKSTTSPLSTVSSRNAWARSATAANGSATPGPWRSACARASHASSTRWAATGISPLSRACRRRLRRAARSTSSTPPRPAVGGRRPACLITLWPWAPRPPPSPCRSSCGSLATPAAGSTSSRSTARAASGRPTRVGSTATLTSARSSWRCIGSIRRRWCTRSLSFSSRVVTWCSTRNQTPSAARASASSTLS